MKNTIRPIYSELQGYLSQAPEATSGRERIYDDTSLVDQLNSSIDELQQVSQKDYSRYKEVIRSTGWNGSMQRYFDLLSYRSKLGGLISRLYGEYFSDEIAPFSSMPSTVINQHQSQNQFQSQNVVLELHERIISEIPKHAEGTKERSFLEKLKSSLSTVKNITDILAIALKLGGEFGLDPATIHKLLGL